jgi:hypothetical protein
MCTAPAYGQDTQSGSNPLEYRLDLIIEFDSIVAEYLDRLLNHEMPGMAMLEWCEKAEGRAMGYPRAQQAFGEFYLSIKSCLKGDARRARIAFQRALRLMGSERYDVIKQHRIAAAKDQL